MSYRGRSVRFRTAVTLDLGGGKHRLEKTRVKGFSKGVFENKGCWGLPQQLLATIGCLEFKDKFYKEAHTQE